MGLVSFWLDSEYTYGSVETHDYSDMRILRGNELSQRFASMSRKSVLEHCKFKEIFAPYSEAIGIDVA